MMPGVRMTRGRLTAAWLVLRTLDKLGGQAEASEVMGYARRSSLRGGGLPLHDGARLACEGGFIVERAGLYAMRPLGERALGLGVEDEPTSSVLRLFVKVLLLRDPPAWVAWWQGAPHDLEAVIPEGERIVLRDAGLLPQPPPTDPEGWGWWQALARVPLPEHVAIERKHIGDAGESLTVAYERARLTEQGHIGLAAQVAWLAQESDAYGFDVLSFAGDNHQPLAPDTPIAIEVKSTTLPPGPYLRCFLTAHEWETALGLGERYIMHFWQAVAPGPPPSSQRKSPVVMPASSLTDHLPGTSACGDACGWQSARIELRVA